MKGTLAVDWLASSRAAALVWRSALLVFAVLRRRGLAESGDGEMLAITSIGIVHVLLVAAII